MKIVLLGNPMSTQHLYGQKGRVRYMKAGAKKLKDLYIEQIQEQYSGEIIKDNLLIRIDLYFRDRRKRDWDNWHKLSMDALEGTVVENDSQFDCNGVYRHYDKKNPRIELTIERCKNT